jgi:formylglycine-generating enzyme required for sulfatase activity
MTSLAEFPDLIGFFSYAREDDEDFRGDLSAIRDAIGRNLAALLGRKKGRNFRLWQDVEAIAPGKLWKAEIDKAIGESAFFIPIVTPRAVQSSFCRDEFKAFLSRERTLGRNDLIFPVLYIPVRALQDDAKRRRDRVLTTIGERQFVDWREFRYVGVNSRVFGQEIGRFCEAIAERLHQPWLSPEERALTETRETEKERLCPQVPAEEEAPLRSGSRADADAAAFLTASRPTVLDPAAGVLETVPPRRARAVPSEIAPLMAADESATKPGESFREGSDCPEMIVVPAGRFLMGLPAGQGEEHEHPQHEVMIARPFAVGKFAVTFNEWDACVAAGGCRHLSDLGWGRGRHPVIDVSWDDAQDYVRWLCGVTGKPYRLLSEAEFEYAARAGSGTAYPWGDDILLEGRPMANWRKTNGGNWSAMHQAAPVGSFPANAFGLYDMVGNVWQWMEDCWNESYEGAPTDGSPWINDDRYRRVLRGGSCGSGPKVLRSASRRWGGPGYWLADTGFRVCRTLNP